MKVNLHTHTARCGHASGTDEEYVLAAIEAGYDILGFSDHTPFPYPSSFVNQSAMAMEELEDYISSVLSLKEKYKEQIDIYLGLECEPLMRFLPFLKEIRPRLDYMILGNHGDLEEGPYFGRLSTAKELGHYLNYLLEGMESGLFLYVAHPDLLFNRYASFDADAKEISTIICREANKHKLPLEYNLNGLYRDTPEGCLGYPCPGFWEIAARENVTAVVGVDAHRPPQFLVYDLPAAQQRLRDMGITVLENPLDA